MASRPLPKLYWVFAALLTACTLAALWATAWKVRAQKLAARQSRGEVIEDPGPVSRRVYLARGTQQRVGHYRLALPGPLVVLDEAGRRLAEFDGLSPGDVRGWQELRLSVEAAPDNALELEADFQPGAACRGPGLFHALKPGLRVELPGDRSVTVLAWDPSKPELAIERAPGGRETLGPGPELVSTPAGPALLLR